MPLLSFVLEYKNLIGLLFVIPILLYSQIWFHKEIQILLYFITKRMDFAIFIFAFLFFPGIFMHEASHYIAAKILGIKTGKVSLIPRKTSDNRLQLGFVEIVKTDVLRDTLIGVAPLLVGCIFIAYAGLFQMELSGLSNLSLNASLAYNKSIIENSITKPDFWLWFYLVLVVSSTMFPSKSDRRAWLPVIFIMLIIIGVSLILGAATWMEINIYPLFIKACNNITMIFSISLLFHLLAVIPLFILRKFIIKISLGTAFGS